MQRHIAWILLSLIAVPARGETQSLPHNSFTFEIPIPVNSELGSTVTQAFHDIFQKQGLQFKAVNFPMQRGLEELKFGRVDGTVGRAGDLEGKLGIKNFVRIDVPVAAITLSLWCHDGIRKRTHLLRLGYALGGGITNVLIPFVDQKRIFIVPIQSNRSVVDMIKAGRVDCIVSNEVHLEASGISMKELSGLQKFELLNFQAYPWVSTQYRYLKLIIEDGLRKYNFSASFRKKYLTTGSPCQRELNTLCPDGVVFTSPIDLSNSL